MHDTSEFDFQEYFPEEKLSKLLVTEHFYVTGFVLRTIIHLSINWIC